jgi:large repetitive protein
MKKFKQSGYLALVMIMTLILGSFLLPFNQSLLAATNHPPVAQDQSVSLEINTDVTIKLLATDEDGDKLTFDTTSHPENGFISFKDFDTLIYTPKQDYVGDDFFTFIAIDGKAHSNVAKVTITVTKSDQPRNHAPIAKDQSVKVEMGKSLTLKLEAEDVDGDKLTFSISSNPSYGEIKLNDGPYITYTPDPKYTGEDSFTFVANDGKAISNVAKVSLTIINSNHAPVAKDLSVSMIANKTLNITLSATDKDGDKLTFDTTSSPQHGTISFLDPNKYPATIVYTPIHEYVGSDSFNYIASDGKAISNEAKVSITIRRDNHAPIAQNVIATTTANHLIEISLKATDPDNDHLTYSTSTSPLHGRLAPKDLVESPEIFIYTPNAGYVGNDYFTFKATDGELTSNVATVSIQVFRENRPPVAEGQSATTTVNTGITLTLNATDPDEDPLQFVIKDGTPGHGSLSDVFDTNKVTYTPSQGFTGQDYFVFRAFDGSLYSNYATVSLSIFPRLDMPTVRPKPGNITGSKTVTLTAKTASFIKYTIDRSTPDCSLENGKRFGKSFVIASSRTIKAVACYTVGRITLPSPLATFVYRYIKYTY